MGSSPIISTTNTNALLSTDADGPSLGYPEHAALSQPLHHTLMRGTMSSTQPAPLDRQLPRGHLLVLNRSFRRTLEAENKRPRTIEAYTDAVRLLPPSAKPTAGRF